MYHLMIFAFQCLFIRSNLEKLWPYLMDIHTIAKLGERTVSTCGGAPTIQIVMRGFLKPPMEKSS